MNAFAAAKSAAEGATQTVIDGSEKLFLFVFFLLYFGVPVIMAWVSYSERFPKLDMRDLWTHQGRADKFAVIILGTWWVHTCSMILWTMRETITSADYLTYMGWALPIMAKMFAPPGTPPADQPAKGPQ